MALQAKEVNEIFRACSVDTLPAKESHLIAFAAQLACCDCERAQESIGLARSAGANDEELRCAACYVACACGPTTETNFANVFGKTSTTLGPRVSVELSEGAERGKVALDKKTAHLVSLAVCLVAGCDCAAGHIVEARNAGASEEELARAACITACVAGRTNHWRFASALQCAEGKKACAC